ncbi:hypothetical protein, variant 2 [Blastomyces gilchristii SLH14081]|uniref:Uncharacterized protein n=1 Tax=Blastomyces gilchristii (strain SLH14081) TaxID=559298 RepID=A0A179UER4_BLAGS|nr:uncharacterized protein BDBG_02494 [Blastomyces gilchristii SLH14081]XP_031577114.1 hypothetical protein, variant 1 [Blastomyces gilchristii SLH14081]XP_031577115.1 hypothetical protein, variant 2 [Blastomyces gilchristii SLH14081]OAT06242.1 hypothetical protein BDBG_02494 [Blastomyces gilchristii SLH14081]OAT06243.1 hypothetical protein, variant 1 [Blastomyces gilchristii SLH14081]OAT06244.1 hypothetical protein, variant 2 [Blastomyces gilchristii SLH14081]
MRDITLESQKQELTAQHCLDYAVRVHHKTSFLVPVPGRREVERGYTSKMLPLFDVLEAGKLHLAMIALDRGSYLAQRSNDYLKDSTKKGDGQGFIRWPVFAIAKFLPLSEQLSLTKARLVWREVFMHETAC